MARRQTPTAATPVATEPASAADLVERLELIQQAMRTAMTEGVDYGHGAGNRQAGPVQARRGEARGPVPSRRAAAQRADLGPGRAPDRDLPRDRPRRAVGHEARLRGGDLHHPRTQVRKAPRRSSRAHECGAANIRKSKNPGEGWLLLAQDRTAAAPRSPDGRSSASSSQTRRRDRQSRSARHAGIPRTKIAKKRSFVDAVLSVTGASAIFTQDLGADPTETAAGGPGTGPWSPASSSTPPRGPRSRVCGGDVDRAGTLWATVQAELGGYMPEAAARALLLAAETDARSDREPRDERANTAAPDAPDTAAGDPIADGEAGAGAPANPSPHGARLRAIATASRRERRRAGEPDPQRRRPRADPGRPGAKRAADDAGTDQRGEHRADRAAARHVAPGGRGRDRRDAGRGHERGLRGAGTAPGGMSGEVPRAHTRAPAPAQGQVNPRQRR